VSAGAGATSLIFNAIADLIPDISKLSEPKRLRSGLVHGITAMEVSYR
jgi:cholest-4-en-3-one 26-monooxygenase